MEWKSCQENLFNKVVLYCCIQGVHSYDRAQQNFLFKIAHASTAGPSATPSQQVRVTAHY